MSLSLKSLLISLRLPLLSIAACLFSELGHASNDNFDDDPPPSASAPMPPKPPPPDQDSQPSLRTHFTVGTKVHPVLC